MSIFKKIGKGVSNAAKWTGKNALKIGAIAAPIAALAIPGVGSAVAAGASSLANKVLGRDSAPIVEQAQGSAIGIAPKPTSSGGLFGKGGLFGTGVLASSEWRKYNLTTKWAKKDQKILDKAASILGVPVNSINELKKYFSQEDIERMNAEAYNELVEAGEEPPTDGGNAKTLAYIGGGAILAKLLGIW